MKIRLHPPFGIHDQGRRDNNEDSIYPRAEDGFATAADRLFLVCDGVGGLEKGEVASKIVCETLWDTLRHKEVLNEEEVNYAVQMAEQRIDQYIQGNREAQGMATTLTLLALHEEGATIAHIGDSRVYQIRNGQCIFKTRDHSLVNDLISKDIITEEEALNHPKRNVITRAISGYADHQQADVNLIKDIQADDYFFLCTDGVQESFTDEELLHLFEAKFSNADKINFIKSHCKKKSKDNFSAYLVQVKSVEEEKGILLSLNKEELIGGKYNNIFITALAVITGIIITLFLHANSSENAEQEEHANVEHALEMINNIDTLDIELPAVILPPASDSMLKEDVSLEANLPKEQKIIKGIKKAKAKSAPINKDPMLDEFLEIDSYDFEEAKDLSLIKNKKEYSNNKSIQEVNPSQMDDDLSTITDTASQKKENMPIDSSQHKNL